MRLCTYPCAQATTAKMCLMHRQESMREQHNMVQNVTWTFYVTTQGQAACTSGHITTFARNDLEPSFRMICL